MPRQIASICEYCDRWCARCAFTDRCSAFALQMVVGMCDGDVAAAIELALGRPMVPGRAAPPPHHESADEAPSAGELEETRRSLEARDTRVNESAAMTLARAVTSLAWEWLSANGESVASTSPQLRDALEIMRWDAPLIGAKIHRALIGRDEASHGGGFKEHRVQNDWNGSAKVALISIERSIVAWRTVAEATGDAAAGGVADELRLLQGEIERQFPDARRFKRPGFDAHGGGRASNSG